LNYPDSFFGDENQIGLKGAVWIQANVERRRKQYAEPGAPHIGSKVPGNIPKNQLVLSASGGRQVDFSVYQLVVLPVVRELAELLVGQLGDNFGAHTVIIHPNQTPSAGAVPVLGIVEKTDAGNLGASDCLLPLAVVLDG
jgi:hypothetical protein